MPHPGLVPTVATGVLALLPSCQAPVLGNAAAVRELRIDNPERLPLVVDFVEGDECRCALQVTTDEHLRLRCTAGAYVVRAETRHGPVALPAPLLASVLPADRPLHVSVATPPAAAASDPDFAFVPAGPAVVGDTMGIGQEDERPPRLVDVPAFWIGRREVTNAEFAAFLTAAEPAVDEGWCAFDSRKCLVQREANGTGWTTTAPTLPIVTVSLRGAMAYCAWQTRATGIRHRLPTEIEWEKAARGPASFVFAYGNTYRRAAANQESGALRPVACQPPEGFGCHDMTGNAFEWTSDSYTARHDGDRAAAGPFQVLRGGSFVLDGMYLRNSFRMKQRPDVRTDDFGFRVVRDTAPARHP